MKNYPTLPDQIFGLKEEQINKIILKLAELQYKSKDGFQLVATPSNLFTDVLAIINIQKAEIIKWKEKYEDLREAFNEALEQQELNNN
jgi:hypothetical protein